MIDSEQPFRAAFIVILAATVAISAFHRWSAHRSAGAIPRRAEPRALILGRGRIEASLRVRLVAQLRNAAWLGASQVTLPQQARGLAVILGFATTPVTAWVFRSVGRDVSETVLAKEGQVLVTSGPYH